jgi:rhodanese-like protein
MAPGTLAYAWLGYAGREAAAGNAAAIRYGLIGLALLAAIAFLLRLVRRLRSEEAPRRIEVNELASRLKGSSSLIVIDVRGPDEFAGPLGHIAGAKNLPVGELALRLHQLTACKTRLSSLCVKRISAQRLRPHCSAIQDSPMSACCVAAWNSGTGAVCRSKAGCRQTNHERDPM